MFNIEVQWKDSKMFEDTFCPADTKEHAKKAADRWKSGMFCKHQDAIRKVRVIDGNGNTVYEI